MARKRQVSFDGSPVGHKRPPAEFQFKRGGKKPVGSGRRKGVKNSRTIIEEVMSEEVKAALGGSSRTMSKRELFIRLGYEKAIKAPSIREMHALVRMYQTLAPDSIDKPEPIQVESIPGDEGL